MKDVLFAAGFLLLCCGLTLCGFGVPAGAWCVAGAAVLLFGALAVDG